MTPLDAIGYGILVLMVVGAFSFTGWEIWQSRTRKPPTPPDPRPPSDPPSCAWHQ